MENSDPNSSEPADLHGKYCDMLLRVLLEFGDQIFDSVIDHLGCIETPLGPEDARVALEELRKHVLGDMRRSVR